MKNMNPMVKQVICEEYVAYDVPVDDILACHQVARTFASRVNSRLPHHLHLTVEQCNKSLLSLRKLGEARGGLPRLRGGHGRRRRK